VIAVILDGTAPDGAASGPTLCPHLLSMGNPLPGGCAGYMIVPRAVLPVGRLTRIPEGLGFAETSLPEPSTIDLTSEQTTRNK